MILKEFVEIATTDKFLKAGQHAEKQMAFYLHQEFKDAQDILVLNGIRLEHDNDSHQIDHLIIHKYGIIIIESKSVFGTIKINDFGEWLRLDYKIGMASPIEQGKRQAIFLYKYLNESRLEAPYNPIMNVFRKTTFDDMPIDILIAISDSGIINRPRKFQTENILKADRIVGKIKEIIGDYQKQDRLFNMQPIRLKFKPETMTDLAKYLKGKHAPLITTKDKDIPPISRPVKVELRCNKCGSDSINILYGKYGYYFKCKKCNDTMSIKENCSICDKQLKLRKDGNQFYIECKTCGTSRPFFKNVK
jgi:hypothetical protein